MSETVTLDLVIPESLYRDLAEAVETADGAIGPDIRDFEPDPDDPAFSADLALDPMLILAVTMGAGALVTTISKVLRDHTKPAREVLDFRGGRLRAERYTSNARELVVLTDAGETVYKPEQEPDALAHLKDVILARKAAG